MTSINGFDDGPKLSIDPLSLSHSCVCEGTPRPTQGAAPGQHRLRSGHHRSRRPGWRTRLWASSQLRHVDNVPTPSVTKGLPR